MDNTEVIATRTTAQRPAAILITLVCAYGGCSAAVTAAPDPTNLGCDDSYAVDTPLGRITNNIWNRKAAASGPAEQCVRAREISGAREYGWSWRWPTEGDALISFPQVVLGWKPWNGGTSSHAMLPRQIKAIRRLRLSYEMATTARGKHSLATTLWITRTGTVGAEPNPHDISTDLMIWTDGIGFDPFGTRAGRTNVDGIDFEVWHARELGDGASNGPRWSYVAYRASGRSTTASLDLKKLIEHAIAQGYISPDHYVSDVEVGNEIMSGVGETWIKRLTLEAE